MPFVNRCFSFAKGEIARDKNKVISCISDILRLEEERCTPTEALLRDILVVLEAQKEPKALQHIFLGKEV